MPFRIIIFAISEMLINQVYVLKLFLCHGIFAWRRELPIIIEQLNVSKILNCFEAIVDVKY